MRLLFCALTPGGDSASGEQALIDSCDVIAESLRSPVQLSTDLTPRHCDVTASSRESLLMTSLDHNVVYVIRSGLVVALLVTVT